MSASLPRGPLASGPRLGLSFLPLLIAALALFAPPARAHEMSMAEMEVRETAPGELCGCGRP